MMKSNLRVLTLGVLISNALIACGSGSGDGSENTGNGTPSGQQTSTTPAEDEPASQQNAPDGGLFIEQDDLSWTPCGEPLECAELTVPIDYANPTANVIHIDLIRYPAKQQTRKGSLLTNPGGPGGSGIELVRDLIEFNAIPPAILAEFDIVGFDPRGVAGSSAINCTDDNIELDDAYPNTRAEVELVYNAISQFAGTCFEQYGSYVQFLGSNNVVRDMEEIRKAMQEPMLNFLGYSYGTRIAALYLQAYPATSGRMILDGSMPPQPDTLNLWFGGMQAAQVNISSMLAKCTIIDAQCDSGELAIQLQNKVDALEAAPGPRDEINALGAILQLAATIPAIDELVIKALHPYLTAGNINPLITLLARINEILGDSGVNTGAYLAVMCADDPARPTVDSLVGLLPTFNAASDLLAESYVSSAAICAGWPESIDPIPVIATGQAPVSLVIGGPTDAQTPLQWAKETAFALGGQFLRSEHEGHTVVFSQTNVCSDAAAENFLREGLLPATDNCPANLVAAADLQEKKLNALKLQLRRSMRPVW
ncbi:MAG: alpha/beta fold hydrolase [Granulosicoccus sp.]